MRAAAPPSPLPNVAMAPPEVIAVRHTEEEAGYVSFRPVVRQNFRLSDLLGLVLGVTGKQPARIRQILRSGSVSFHSHRYWWDGFQVEEHDLAALLARFPDSDPSRAFRPEACTAALLEAGGSPSRPDSSGLRPLGARSRRRLAHPPVSSAQFLGRAARGRRVRVFGLRRILLPMARRPLPARTQRRARRRAGRRGEVARSARFAPEPARARPRLAHRLPLSARGRLTAMTP